MNKIIVYLICLVSLICFSALPGYSESIQLGTPLSVSAPLSSQSARSASTLRGVSVSPRTQQASKDFYYSQYVGAGSASMNWTGSHASCDAGTTAEAYKSVILMHINYFRAMAGLPAEVTFNSTYSEKAQEAALMMSVNSQLSHSPTSDWTCYTADGAEAAGSSNLAMGYPSLSNVIAGYVKDQGSSNYAAGHRRWILYPQTEEMGTGDVPSATGYSYAANALWVFDSNMWAARPATRDTYVAWPPPGYVPYQVVYPRWSFAYDDADLSGATVTMTRDGSSISVSQETYKTGYGENTLVWIPLGMSSTGSWSSEHLVAYSVTVSNVLISSVSTDFTYTVNVFDPAQPVTSDTGYVPAVNFLLLDD